MSVGQSSWLSVLTALGPLIAASATLLVGLMVAAIAYRQWLTAHQKLVLDLFEKRFAIYDEVMQVHDAWQSEMIPLSKVKETTRALRKIERKAMFLFGADVTASISELRSAITDLAPFLRQMDSAEKHQRNQIYEAAQPTERRIKSWRTNFPEICLPYMRLDQKR